MGLFRLTVKTEKGQSLPLGDLIEIFHSLVSIDPYNFSEESWEEIAIEESLDPLFWEEMKWREQEEDMIELSKKYPYYVFSLEERWEDGFASEFYKNIYKNGSKKHFRGKVVYSEEEY